MAFSTVDDDISDFFDWMSEGTQEFETAELRTFLLNEGHSLEETVSAIVAWQQQRFIALDPDWVRFKLSEQGRAAIAELQRATPTA